MAASTDLTPPKCQADTAAGRVALTGDWVFGGVQPVIRQLGEEIASLIATCQHWDLTGLTQFDSTAALLLWQSWGEKLPDQLEASPAQLTILRQLAALPPSPPAVRTRSHPLIWLRNLLTFSGEIILKLLHNLLGVLILFGRVLLATFYIIGHPRELPWRELSANIFKAGVMALGITAIVGFLIGIVLSYLSSLQLARFGANILIVDLLGVSILRELGPLLAAILVAGRSGSAITAQLGIMKINDELDAMSALGISQSLRLAWPKVLALVIAMPLLALWTDSLALIGGMLAAQNKLGLPVTQFLDRLPEAVGWHHLWIGLWKSTIFGGLIGLIACHFGFSVKSSSESLGFATTSSVVTSITMVILADAVVAMLQSLSDGGGF